MKIQMVLFLIGLILFMTGIYISTIWEIPGMIMGIFGGMTMGSSMYFFVNQGKQKDS
ncbi:hypothetical protein ACFOZY_00645 [Chungangia koreensis]|uniref:Uncharacterized protein n=1 Tax=Chungangia koreensis TaxID=752657 RepID=A0ABV8X0P7_9LACT